MQTIRHEENVLSVPIQILSFADLDCRSLSSVRFLPEGTPLPSDITCKNWVAELFSVFFFVTDLENFKRSLGPTILGNGEVEDSSISNDLGTVSSSICSTISGSRGEISSQRARISELEKLFESLEAQNGRR
jgi:hypothetical protein